MNRGLIPDIRQKNNNQWVENVNMIANPTTGGLFTEAKTGSTTGITMTAAQGGRLRFDPTHGTPAANHEDNIYTTIKPFAWANGNIFGVRGRLLIGQANTNKLNLFFGISSIATTGGNADGGGPAASFSGAGIYIQTASTVFKTIDSVGSTQNTNTSTKTAASTSVQELKVEVECVSDTLAVATFFVDGNPLLDSNGQAIKHVFTYTGAVACGVYVGVKQSSTTPETGVYLDDISFYGNEANT